MRVGCREMSKPAPCTPLIGGFTLTEDANRLKTDHSLLFLEAISKIARKFFIPAFLHSKTLTQIWARFLFLYSAANKPQDGQKWRFEALRRMNLRSSGAGAAQYSPRTHKPLRICEYTCQRKSSSSGLLCRNTALQHQFVGSETTQQQRQKRKPQNVSSFSWYP